MLVKCFFFFFFFFSLTGGWVVVVVFQKTSMPPPDIKWCAPNICYNSRARVLSWHQPFKLNKSVSKLPRAFVGAFSIQQNLSFYFFFYSKYYINPSSPERFFQTYCPKGGLLQPPLRIINIECHITLNLLPMYSYGPPLSIDTKISTNH